MRWEECLKGPYVDKENDVLFRLLPAGTDILHGTYSDVTKADMRSRPNFFADRCTAYTYCESCKDAAQDETPMLYQFTVKRELRLLDMGHCRTVRRVMALWKKHKAHINKAFICPTPRSRKPVRYSHRKIDKLFVHMFCAINGFDGYCAEELRNKDGGVFHAELYICDTKSLSAGKKVEIGVCRRRRPI